MTGLTRKEVRRIRDKIDSGSEAAVGKSSPLAVVLHTWFSDPDFVDASGKPLTLCFDGPSPSFTEIVKRAGGDIPPGAMRTELKRIEAIKELDDGSLVALKRYATAKGQDQIMITGLTTGIAPLATTIAHNVEAPDHTNVWLQRTVATDSVRGEDVGRLRRISYDRLEEFTEAMDDLYSAYETLHSADDGDRTEPATIGVGVFYFES